MAGKIVKIKENSFFGTSPQLIGSSCKVIDYFDRVSGTSFIETPFEENCNYYIYRSLMYLSYPPDDEVLLVEFDTVAGKMKFLAHVSELNLTEKEELTICE